MTSTQPADANLVGVLLESIVAAMVDRGGLTRAEKDARANSIMRLVATIGPSDPIQTMLVGQCLLFNELVADGGRDILRGMMDTLKLRAQSNLSKLSGSLRQNLDMFLRLHEKSETLAAAAEVEAETAAPGRQAVEGPAPPPKPVGAGAVRPGPHRTPEVADATLSVIGLSAHKNTVLRPPGAVPSDGSNQRGAVPEVDIRGIPRDGLAPGEQGRNRDRSARAIEMAD